MNSLKNKELDSQQEMTKNSKIKICPNCKEPIEKDIEILGTIRRVPIICRCKKEEIQAKEKKDKANQKQERLKRLFKNSLMDEKFKIETFENWDDSVGSEQIKNIALKYCKNFKTAKENGLGLLIYGKPGNGKTYAVNCIANNLLKREYPVICVSINSLLERIKDTYKRFGDEGEATILKSLGQADLLIIDDLGTEQASNWSISKIYNIIDSRYRNGLPLIITTNCNLEALKEKYTERTADRITEMCTPLQNNGKSIRQEKAKTKANLMREIMR